MKRLASLKLTITCLFLSLILVFIGTLYQINQGAFAAQSRIFQSFFIYWQTVGGMEFPVFPGGYLICVLFLINLLALMVYRLRFSLRSLGLYLIHFSLLSLALGELLNSFSASESVLPIKIGERKNYAYDVRRSELAVILKDDEEEIIFPENLLKEGMQLDNPRLPFYLHVQKIDRDKPVKDSLINDFIMQLDIIHKGEKLDQFLVALTDDEERPFPFLNRTYHFSLRPKKKLFPFVVELTEFIHEDHPGTEIPKFFSSRMKLYSPDATGEHQAYITMNHPLKFQNKTFYQSGYGKEDNLSILQVVDNPFWVTPYLSCGLVIAGLLFHFVYRLYFQKRDKPA